MRASPAGYTATPAGCSGATIDPERASTVRVGEDAFGLGIGAIGGQFTDAAPRMGELIAAAGVVAYQPTEGGSVPDYLIGTAEQPASAVLGSGLMCEGGFETLSRFSQAASGPAGAALGAGASVPRPLVVADGGRGDAGGGGGAGGCAAPALAGGPGAPGATSRMPEVRDCV